MFQQGLTKLRILLLFLSVIVIAGIITFGVFQLRGLRIFPIETVSFQGDFQFVDKGELQTLVKPLLSQSDFFTVDLKTVQSEIQKLPWVAQSEVKRVWPDQVIINVSEEQPIAYWNQDRLLNAYGEVFAGDSALTISKDLPQFLGQRGSMIKMLDQYQRIKVMLQPLDLKIKVIALDLSGAWQIELDNGMKLQLGQKQILTSLQHFVKVYHKVFKARLAKRVDLRYDHGMAVEW